MFLPGCSPELPGFAEHIQTASGSRLEPTSLGSLSSGARSLGKGCQPSQSSANESLSSTASTGWGCAQLPSSPLQSWDRSKKSVLPFTSRGLCLFFFFLKHHFQQHHPLPRKSTPQNMTALGGNSPWVFGNVWGNTRKKKKKSTHPSFRPQYLSANTQQWSAPPTSFHPARNPGKHLNSGTAASHASLLMARRPSPGERFWIILSNKSPPWEPREDWKY